MGCSGGCRTFAPYPCWGTGAFVILWNSAKTNETESVNEDTVAESNDNEEETNEIESTDTTDPVEEETQTEPPLFSKRIWDYDGTIYTSYAMDNTNWTSLTGDYHDTFIAYHNNIYLRRANIENSDTRELVCEDIICTMLRWITICSRREK